MMICPKLVALSEEYNGASYPLDKPIVTIGRLAAQNVALDDPRVSLFHASLIEQSNGEFLLKDHNSTNGTAVNNVIISECILHNGDVINVGGLEFLFDCDPNPVYSAERTETGWDIYYKKSIDLTANAVRENAEEPPIATSTMIFYDDQLKTGNISVIEPEASPVLHLQVPENAKPHSGKTSPFTMPSGEGAAPNHKVLHKYAQKPLLLAKKKRGKR